MRRLLLTAAAALFGTSMALAFDTPQEPERRLAVVCDTPAQVERFISLVRKENDPFSPLAEVNAEFGAHACILATVVCRPLKIVSRASNRFGDWMIVEAQILAAVDGGGRLVGFPPNQPHYFIIMPEVDRKA